MKSFFKYTKIILADKNPKKSFFKIIGELITCFIKYREVPFFYFHKMLYRKSSGNYLDYLSHKEWVTLIKSSYLHNSSYTEIFRNKLLFDRVFREANIRIPNTVAYKIGDYIYNTTSKTNFNFYNIDELEKILSDHLISRYGKVFVKTMDTMGGANCYVLQDSNKKEISKILMSLDLVLFQEVITQHHTLMKINPSSINTLRFDVFRNDINEIVFLNALLRVGVGGNVVDNASSGGFFVKVDVKTGVLGDVGRQFLKFGGNIYYQHPNTKVSFGGIQIPYFNDAKSIIIEAMDTVNERLVGWDVALTPDGPLIMEGNHSLSLFMSDIVIQGYKKNVSMREILNKIK